MSYAYDNIKYIWYPGMEQVAGIGDRRTPSISSDHTVMTTIPFDKLQLGKDEIEQQTVIFRWMSTVEHSARVLVHVLSFYVCIGRMCIYDIQYEWSACRHERSTCTICIQCTTY